MTRRTKTITTTENVYDSEGRILKQTVVTETEEPPYGGAYTWVSGNSSSTNVSWTDIENKSGKGLDKSDETG